jgi:predicted lipid-binding transport protein (Tim44 family)
MRPSGTEERLAGVFYIIAALFLSVGFALFLATRPRKPQTQAAKGTASATTAPSRTAPASSTRKRTAGRVKPTPAPKPARAASPARPRPHRRGRHADEPQPQRISREEYLRELAERTRIMQAEHQASERQNH